VNYRQPIYECQGDRRSYAPLVKAPTTIIVADKDEIVPGENATALFSAFPPGLARIRFIPGARHNSISDSPGFVEKLKTVE
jgi:hypothetical protein